jgi:hypothetical protein
MSVAARLGRLMAVVIVFVVIGPPVGALVLVGLVESTGIYGYGELDRSDRSWVTIFDLIYAVPVSYWVGAAPAAAAALAIGIRQAFFGRATWPMALATGLIVGIVVLDRSGRQPFADLTGDHPFPASSAIVVLACLAATMVCWVLVRPWYVAPRPAAERSSMESTP